MKDIENIETYCEILRAIERYLDILKEILRDIKYFQNFVIDLHLFTPVVRLAIFLIIPGFEFSITNSLFLQSLLLKVKIA